MARTGEDVDSSLGCSSRLTSFFFSPLSVSPGRNMRTSVSHRLSGEDSYLRVLTLGRPAFRSQAHQHFLQTPAFR
jgi:hypothetical protein